MSPLFLRKLTLLLAASLTVMAGATVAAALPAMRDHFQATPQVDLLTRLVITMPALFIAFTAPAAGLIADRLGRLRLLFVCLVLYTLGGMSGFFLDDLYFILGGRALLGLAVAGTMTVTVALAGDYFTGEARTSFLSLQAAFMALGGLVFVSLGGFLADFSWRFPFLIYAFALVVLILAISFLQEPKRQPSPRSADGKRIKAPLPGLAWLIYAIAFCGMVLFYLVPVQIPFLLKQVGTESNTLIGLAIGLVTVSAATASGSYRRIRDRLGYWQISLFTFLMLALGYGFVWLADSYAGIAFGIFISGTGAGMVMPNSNVWLLSVAGEQARGAAVGGLTAAIFLGQFASPLLVAPMTSAGISLNGAFGWAALGSLVLAGGCTLGWQISKRR
jgi:MFS family permease